MIGQVPERMAAGLHHVEQGFAQPHLVALVEGPVERRDAGDLLGPDDLAARDLLDPRVAAGVVGVPVGVQDQVQAPSQRLQFGQDRLGVGRVDAAGLAARLVADQETVVILQAGELVDLQRHGRHPWRKPPYMSL